MPTDPVPPRGRSTSPPRRPSRRALARLITVAGAGVTALCASVAVLRAQMPTARWTLTPDLRIGSEIKGPAYQLSRVSTIVANDSGVYIVLGTEQEIRQFDMRGNHVRTIGRKGQGPGEFGGMSALGFLGDTLFVVDGMLRRTSFFAKDGTLISTTPWQARTDPVPGATVMTVGVGALMRDGSAFASLGISPNATRAPVLRVTRAGAVMDTLAWQEVKSAMVIPASGGTLNAIQPFRDGTLSALVPTVGRVILVDRTAATSTRSAAFKVMAIGVKQDTIFSRSYSYTPVAIDSKIVDSLVQGVVKGPGGVRLAVTEKDVRAALYNPGFWTPIARVVGAADGSVWLNLSDARPTADWMVLAPNGDPQATVTLPPRAQLVMIRGDAVWAIEPDADDVPTVVRYRVNRR